MPSRHRLQFAVWDVFSLALRGAGSISSPAATPIVPLILQIYADQISLPRRRTACLTLPILVAPRSTSPLERRTLQTSLEVDPAALSLLPHLAYLVHHKVTHGASFSRSGQIHNIAPLSLWSAPPPACAATWFLWAWAGGIESTLLIPCLELAYPR